VSFRSGKASTKPARKRVHALGVQRGGLQTLGGIGDVILRSYVRLCRVVALIEDLDPPAEDGLVAFY
jgi:hypothetical protein